MTVRVHVPKSITVYSTEQAHVNSHIEPDDFICVYGTLRGHLGDGTRMYNHRLMLPVASNYQGKAAFTRVAMWGGIRQVPYAVLTHVPSDITVMEVYGLDHLSSDAMSLFLRSLDGLEGAPNWYYRTRYTDEDGTNYWFYSLGSSPPSHVHRHPTGDWAYTGESK